MFCYKSVTIYGSKLNQIDTIKQYVVANMQSADQLLQVEAQTSEYISSWMRLSCIKCAIELGIPDILHKHANPFMTLSDLIAALPNLNPSKAPFIPILMRLLVHSGLFNYHQQGDGYSLTSDGRLLVENDPFSRRSHLLFTQHPVMLNTFASISDWLCNDLPTAFDTAHGKSLWDYCAGEPEFGNIFNDLMASDSRLLVSNLLISDCCKRVFEDLTSLVDVGGGTGTLAMSIANAFPSLKCIVFDIPHVIGDRKGTGNMEFVAGNMFDKIPHANAILLKWILHNWSDQDCVNLLKKCKESIPSKEKGGKVIIIDIVMNDNSSNEQLVQAQHLMDFMMRIIHASKERTKKEWEKLFLDAGFSAYKIITSLGLRSLIEIYP
ncbi:myricetin 7/4'-O-methyltransferase 2-like [Lycium ferocissimum]|uniref:myricetin 7/4'-O-methyltransferase 2-like n=1 Tax=Lycium ferocissimum TaxID=112874 RepID=UPI002814F48A|nr:myricetin 7/4'-O-methyltransferase 2-like [Lycium ferocissimum]